MSVSNHGGAQLAEAVRHAYAAGQDDYHLEPMVLTERGIPGRPHPGSRRGGVLLPPG